MIRNRSKNEQKEENERKKKEGKNRISLKRNGGVIKDEQSNCFKLWSFI